MTAEPSVPEDVRLGLPGPLPTGETVLFAAKPTFGSLLLHLFHIRIVGVALAIFALIPAWRLLDAGGSLAQVMLSPLLMAPFIFAVLAILFSCAWVMARTTTYIVTNRRVILLVGWAITRMVNIPLKKIVHAGLRERGGGVTDIAITIDPSAKIGWLALWPHNRLRQFTRPVPMLRALPRGEALAEVLTNALMVASPGVRHGADEAEDDHSGALPAFSHG